MEWEDEICLMKLDGASKWMMLMMAIRFLVVMICC